MDLILVLIAIGVAVASIGPRGPVPEPPMAEVAPAPPPAPETPPAPKFAPLPETDQAEAAPAPKFAPLPETDQAEAAPAPKFAPLPDTQAPGFSAEDQTPSGKFTTAGEVRMILDATKGSWVAVRDYGGQDLLYFTQLLAWRCGLHQIEYAVNDGAMQVFAAEPCYADTAQPNAIKAETNQPYLAFPPGSVQSVTVRLLYDDLEAAEARFERGAILMP